MGADKRETSVRSARGVDLVGVGLVLAASTQFGAVVVLGKIATRRGGLPVPTLLSVRFAVSAVLLAVALAVLRQPLRAAKGEGWRLAALGVGGYAVEAAFFFTGLKHGTAAAATVLFFTYPVAVSLIAFLLGRGLPGWLLGGALFAAVGGAAIVGVAGGGADIDGLGVLFELVSSVVYAGYLVGTEGVLKRTNSLTGAVWVATAAAAGLAVYALLTGAAEVPLGWRQWGPILGMGVFTAGAFVTLLGGLRRVGAVRTAILSASEPLTAAAMAAIFLGERVRMGTLGGGILILTAAVAASVARGRSTTAPPVP
jgi:drug/metabolite transporter (DMT)-like permease